MVLPGHYAYRPSAHPSLCHSSRLRMRRISRYSGGRSAIFLPLHHSGKVRHVNAQVWKVRVSRATSSILLLSLPSPPPSSDALFELPSSPSPRCQQGGVPVSGGRGGPGQLLLVPVPDGAARELPQGLPQRAKATQQEDGETGCVESCRGISLQVGG